MLPSHVSNDLARCLLMIQPMVKAGAWSPDTGLIFLLGGGVGWVLVHRPQTHKVTEWHVLSWRPQLLNLCTERERVYRGEWRGFKRIPPSSLCLFEAQQVTDLKLIGTGGAPKLVFKIAEQTTRNPTFYSN